MNRIFVLRRYWRQTLVTASIALLLIALAYHFLAPKTALAAYQFTTIDGQTISSDQLKGKVVVVNFWATSCSTCVQEMPQMVALHQQFKDQAFVLLAPAMAYDEAAYIRQFVQARQLPFLVTHDASGQLSKIFDNVAVTPTTFVLDPQQRIQKRYVGIPDFAAMAQTITALLPSS